MTISIEKTFTILRRKRKYLECRMGNSNVIFDLIKTPETDDLPLKKEITAKLTDRSIRTKYGTKLFFSIASHCNISILDYSDINNCYLIRSKLFNVEFIEKAKRIGGRWLKEDKVWQFPPSNEDLAEELDEEYSSYTMCLLEFTDHLIEENKGIYLGGVLIAQASSKKSGSKFGPLVTVLNGKTDSGGSKKYWNTQIKRGAKLRVPLPSSLIEKLKIKYKEQILFTELDILGDEYYAFINS